MTIQYSTKSAQNTINNRYRIYYFELKRTFYPEKFFVISELIVFFCVQFWCSDDRRRKKVIENL